MKIELKNSHFENEESSINVFSPEETSVKIENCQLTDSQINIGFTGNTHNEKIIEIAKKIGLKQINQFSVLEDYTDKENVFLTLKDNISGKYLYVVGDIKINMYCSSVSFLDAKKQLIKKILT